jgi:hypothetical protein
MAVRFDASADYYSRTSGTVVDANSSYTWMAWVRRSGSGFSAIWSASPASGTEVDYVGWNSSNQFYSYVEAPGGFTEGTGSTLTVDTWYHLCCVRSSTTLLTGYLDGVSDWTNGRDLSTRASITRNFIATYNAGSDPANARVYAIKAWSAALSSQEILVERQIIRPMRTNGLVYWNPCFAGSPERARDYSGGGLNWTENGTLTDEDPPPVSFGSQSIVYPFVPAGAGSGVGWAGRLLVSA